MYCSESKNSRKVSVHDMEDCVGMHKHLTLALVAEKYRLRAPSALSPGKGASLPTGQETKYILEGVLIGAFVYPHVSNWSNFIVGVRVKSKLLRRSHTPMLATYPTQAVLYTDILLHSKHLVTIR